MKFPFYRQLNAMDCGPTCLRMVAKFLGKNYSADGIRKGSGFNRQGVSLLGLSEAAEEMGFRTRGMQLAYEQLISEVPLPCILYWDQCHFVVLISVSVRRKDKGKIKIADPAKGILTYSKQDFLSHWITNNDKDGINGGIALLLEPTPAFYEREGEKESVINWTQVLQYLRQSRWQLMKVIAALIVTSLLQLILPYLTQSIVDTGIKTKNLRFITIILLAQITLVISRSLVDFIRARLLLRISTTINTSILSDFWIKLTRLPISYFDRHHAGDTFQRISDNKQIQNFLTGNVINTLFSLFNFIIYSIVLISYNIKLFFIFSTGSVLYFIWVKIFLKIRRKINYQTFHILSRENMATLQLVEGMQELKLNNAEQLKRWEWENIQAGLFKLNFKNLTISQVQQAGALLINQGKDILITFLVARLVINNELTLGMMLAIQYILGQLSSPVEQFISFMQSAQDAKISMERLNEIHKLENEEVSTATYIKTLPEHRSITLSNVSFSYPGTGNCPVLQNIQLVIPEAKVTAIVGLSGSGKTTLLKLLLKFYEDYSGEIKVGNISEGDGANFKDISPSFWRNNCGAVLQDGYIFNDSIARNIAVGDERPDYLKLVHCSKVANIFSFIESLPNGFNTQLGTNGSSLSQGQKQRILIARAIYKAPQYIFFDEATNALDSTNERIIVENLKQFFEGRTVVVVAHRLSTVKNADKIIVLQNGSIVEEGTHLQLCQLKGSYYELVKNQLELDA